MTQIKMSRVLYNAANQCFEALVTLQSGEGSKTYACAIDAPITMSFEEAAEGLKTQAVRQSKKTGVLYSQMRHRAGLRAGRARFDPRAWLSQLGFSTVDRAA